MKSEKRKTKSEKSKCFVSPFRKYYFSTWIFHSSFFTLHLNMLFTSVRRTTFANVPADLRSAGIEYKDL